MKKFISCLILFVVLISGIGFVCAEDSGINSTEVNTSQDNENIYYPADKLPSSVPVGSPLINTSALEPVYGINGEINGYRSLKYGDGIYRMINSTDYIFQLNHTIGDKLSVEGPFYDPFKAPSDIIPKPVDNYTHPNFDLNNISDIFEKLFDKDGKLYGYLAPGDNIIYVIEGVKTIGKEDNVNNGDNKDLVGKNLTNVVEGYKATVPTYDTLYYEDGRTLNTSGYKYKFMNTVNCNFTVPDNDNSATFNIEEENSAVERNSNAQNDVNSEDSQDISDVQNDVKKATGNPILVLLLALFVIGCNFFRQKKN